MHDRIPSGEVASWVQPDQPVTDPGPRRPWRGHAGGRPDGRGRGVGSWLPA
ncbi:MAG TPA: hypothetical protein VKG45_08015 [Actinomycetes bacterium]|nr:hypothetical protein [Actinomycetes bacterium]